MAEGKKEIEAEEVLCQSFTPQRWRKSKCKRCFKDVSQHNQQSSQSKSQSATLSKTQSESQSQTQTKTQSKTQSESQSETQSKTLFKTQFESESQAQPSKKSIKSNSQPDVAPVNTQPPKTKPKELPKPDVKAAHLNSVTDKTSDDLSESNADQIATANNQASGKISKLKPNKFSQFDKETVPLNSKAVGVQTTDQPLEERESQNEKKIVQSISKTSPNLRNGHLWKVKGEGETKTATKAASFGLKSDSNRLDAQLSKFDEQAATSPNDRKTTSIKPSTDVNQRDQVSGSNLEEEINDVKKTLDFNTKAGDFQTDEPKNVKKSANSISMTSSDLRNGHLWKKSENETKKDQDGTPQPGKKILSFGSKSNSKLDISHNYADEVSRFDKPEETKTDKKFAATNQEDDQACKAESEKESKSNQLLKHEPTVIDEKPISFNSKSNICQTDEISTENSEEEPTADEKTVNIISTANHGHLWKRSKTAPKLKPSTTDNKNESLDSISNSEPGVGQTDGVSGSKNTEEGKIKIKSETLGTKSEHIVLEDKPETNTESKSKPDVETKTDKKKVTFNSTIEISQYDAPKTGSAELENVEKSEIESLIDAGPSSDLAPSTDPLEFPPTNKPKCSALAPPIVKPKPSTLGDDIITKHVFEGKENSSDCEDSELSDSYEEGSIGHELSDSYEEGSIGSEFDDWISYGEEEEEDTGSVNEVTIETYDYRY